MKRRLARTAVTILVLIVAVFWLLFFSPRPPLTINPDTLAGDGSLQNYCELPVLDGSGKLAAEIPKGNTPGCGYAHFPLPILADCTEPLIDGAADIRGLWVGVEGKVGHVERIEQCGGRTVITSSGVIHDAGPNSTAHINTDDTEGGVLFTLGNTAYCPRTSASMTWNDGTLNFNLLGWGPIVVQRYLQGEQLVWEYADGSITRMDRLCQLPSASVTPQPRGRRFQFFPKNS
ncbi:MAG: hypothetical protein QNL99_15035 [SAR86 cluster bacterium]